MHYKAIKYRIYPTKKQIKLISQSFGIVRFVYNKVLDEQFRRLDNHEALLSKNRANEWVNHELKPLFPWIKEADKFAVTNATYAVSDAFTRFFSGQNSRPKCKRKNRRDNHYTTNFTNKNIELIPSSKSNKHGVE